MDKVKQILAVAKKYQFWVFCGVMVVTSLVCWWLAKSAVADTYKKREGEIKTAFDGTNIQPGHPNDAKIKEVKDKDEALKKKVLAAWEDIYNKQQQSNTFPSHILGKDFEKLFKSLDFTKAFDKQQEPPTDKNNPKNGLEDSYREQYQRKIKDFLPDLEKIIDARRLVAAPGGPRTLTGSGGDPEKEFTGIVDWDDFDQWGRLMTWDQAPSTQAIVLTQEDLWVLQSLLRVIRNVNEGAKSQSAATIKRIAALEIGKASVKAWTDPNEKDPIYRPGGGAGPGMPTMPPAGGGPMQMPGSGMQPGGLGQHTSSGPSDQALFDGRYIDDKGQPLPSQADFPFVTHSIKEYKMMPVHMSLMVDAKRLPRLLTALANSSVPIDVRRVRVLNEAPASTGGGGGGPLGGGGAGMRMPMPGGGMPMPGGMMPGGMTPPGMMPGGMTPPGMMRGGGMMPPVGPPGGGGMNRPTPGGSAGGETGITDTPVEIFAVVYIYNPPDRVKLGAAPAPGDAAAAPAGAPGTQPSPPTTPATPGR
jgi:hypothetical protein